MLKIKREINQQQFFYLSNFNSLEVVDRVRGTQLQMGKNSKLTKLAVKGLNLLKCQLQFTPTDETDEK